MQQSQKWIKQRKRLNMLNSSRTFLFLILIFLVYYEIKEAKQKGYSIYKRYNKQIVNKQIYRAEDIQNSRWSWPITNKHLAETNMTERSPGRNNFGGPSSKVTKIMDKQDRLATKPTKIQ